MNDLAGKTIIISGSGNGDIARVLDIKLSYMAATIFFTGRDRYPSERYDYAICLSGEVYIGYPFESPVDDLVHSNYTYPTMFIEEAIAYRCKNIIVIGSNAARYGAPYMEDYSALKAALLKYVELRGRTARKMGTKLSILNFGGIDSKFWDKYKDDPLAANIIPDADLALTIGEAVDAIIAIMRLPDNVVIKDATIVSKGYQ